MTRRRRDHPARGSSGRLRGLAFDCDGVMFDSRGANRRYYNLIKEGLGLPPMDRAEEDYVHAHAVGDSLARIVPPERMADASAVRALIDYRDVLPAMRPEPGLYELLWWLRDRGVRLAVYTNRTTTMDLVLETFDLRHYFDMVVTARTVRAKPHPEGMHCILRAWGAAPRDIAYLGDSEVDAATARAAGVPLWAYQSPGLAAARHVDDFWALRRALATGLAGGALDWP